MGTRTKMKFISTSILSIILSVAMVLPSFAFEEKVLDESSVEISAEDIVEIIEEESELDKDELVEEQLIEEQIIEEPIISIEEERMVMELLSGNLPILRLQPLIEMVK